MLSPKLTIAIHIDRVLFSRINLSKKVIPNMTKNNPELASNPALENWICQGEILKKKAVRSETETTKLGFVRKLNLLSFLNNA
jgi:hypothetical protein